LEQSYFYAFQKTSKARQDQVAAKSAVQQGIYLKSEEADRLSLSQEAAVHETGLLTKAQDEKKMAALKAKKSGVNFLQTFLYFGELRTITYIYFIGHGK
jgi:hypothetical protein